MHIQISMYIWSFYRQQTNRCQTQINIYGKFDSIFIQYIKRITNILCQTDESYFL